MTISTANLCKDPGAMCWIKVKWVGRVNLSVGLLLGSSRTSPTHPPPFSFSRWPRPSSPYKPPSTSCMWPWASSSASGGGNGQGHPSPSSLTTW